MFQLGATQLTSLCLFLCNCHDGTRFTSDATSQRQESTQWSSWSHQRPEGQSFLWLTSRICISPSRTAIDSQGRRRSERREAEREAGENDTVAHVSTCYHRVKKSKQRCEFVHVYRWIKRNGHVWNGKAKSRHAASGKEQQAGEGEGGM